MRLKIQKKMMKIKIRKKIKDKNNTKNFCSEK